MRAVEGKVAVVTGASAGIGEAIVKELVAAGMIVAGLARRVEKVEISEMIVQYVTESRVGFALKATEALTSERCAEMKAAVLKTL